jgi:2-dehydro-3-deoxyphosphogluconate aldolase/(4S)-4-hydroxy-2-oxoglutarate aldolase
MDKAAVLKQIVDVGVVPIIRASNAEEALLAVEAVREGGIPIVEITMTVPGAVELIRSLVKRIGETVLIGAGTVLDAQTARDCISAGAEFVVSPGLDIETIKLVKAQGKAMLAGALSPTEIITAWKAGSDFVKIFPCAVVGGPKYLKALKGPLPQIPMVPTGGVDLTTAAEFILAGAAALGVGGDLVDPTALKSRKGDVITRNAREFLELVRKARAQQTAATRA